jgi:PTH1 family peptidyl-tRNA hydrolase
MITHLVIGLGNPEPEYKNTWHNIGVEVLKKLAAQAEASPLAFEKKFNALVGRAKVGDNELLLAAPQTFMNLSGESVAKLLSFYKLNAKQVIVLQDDIDLPLGQIRITSGSSAGGHNGIKSIIEQIGTQEFLRLKLGVATERLELVGAKDYVTEKYPADQESVVNELITNGAAALMTMITESPAAAMNKFN